MNIYDMLRLIIKGLARKGAISKQEAFDAIELIKKLQQRGALGTITGETEGNYNE